MHLRMSRDMLLAASDKLSVERLCNYMNFRQFTFSFPSFVTSSRLTEFRNWVVNTPVSYLRIPCFISRPKILLSVCQQRLLNIVSNWVTFASFHVTYNSVFIIPTFCR